MKLVFLTLISAVYYAVHVAAQTLQTNGNDDIKRSIENGISSFTVKLNKLFHDKSNAGENVLFSPINIYAALALTHLGADGDTRNEISQLLGLSSNSEEIHSTHENLGKILKRVQNSRKTEIIIADNIFVQNGFPFKVAYLNQARSYYRADVNGVNFKDAKSNSTEIINRWISNKTKGRIPTLFSSPLPQDTVMLIASSLYFAGSWFAQFMEEFTVPEKFNTGAAQIDVQMMSNKKDIPYSNNPSLQYEAINLPYYGHELSMFFVLPYTNQTLKNLTHHMSTENLQQIVSQTTEEYSYVQYKIPRMKFKSQRKINQDLSDLGIKTLFDRPKLTNMIAASDIKVSEVIHAVEIEVQEKGTVATAVTTLSFVPLSLPFPPAEPIPFYLNRPFMFFIYHYETKTVLFSGLVYKPVADV